MAKKIKHGSKLTDAERHKRFVEMAREVQASEDPKDFDKALETVAKPKHAALKKAVKAPVSRRRADP